MNNLNAAGAIADVGHGWDECVHILKVRNLIKPGMYGRFHTAWGVGETGPKAVSADPRS
jgi:hypothetical protein